MRMSNGKILVGGMPDITPNATTVNKVVEASVTDIRYVRRRSARAIRGVTDDGRTVKRVCGDMQGLARFNLWLKWVLRMILA